MKKIFTLFFLLIYSSLIFSQTLAEKTKIRAQNFSKVVPLHVWLENTYTFFNAYYPDTNRYKESDLRMIRNLCFNTIRLPVAFELLTISPTNGTFDTTNPKTQRAFARIDSVLKWAAANDLNVILDNHIPDDVASYDLQNKYGLLDANYADKKVFLTAIWEQLATRYKNTDPNKVLYELRNEPNQIGQVYLNEIYKSIITKIRSIDPDRSLMVGCTGYYDGNTLSQSNPYDDKGIIYVFHSFEPINVTFQGIYGYKKDSMPYPEKLSSSDISYLTDMFTSLGKWSKDHQVAVHLGEFGMTSYAEIFGKPELRLEYYKLIAKLLYQNDITWSFWGAYGPTDYREDWYTGNWYYMYSIFDSTNILDQNHLNKEIASYFNIGQGCSPTINEGNDFLTFTIPNQIGNSIINAKDSSVKIIMPSTANLNNLPANFSISYKATIDQNSGNSFDFSSPKYFTITSQKLVSKKWNVTLQSSNSIQNNTQSIVSIYPNPTNLNLVNLKCMESIKNIKMITPEGKILNIDWTQMGDTYRIYWQKKLAVGVYRIEIELKSGNIEYQKLSIL